MPSCLPCIEVETGGAVRSSVIWLHGLGANGHDFEPIVPHLGLHGLGVRFIFPHAPKRAVTINMGLIMPAWYDVGSAEIGRDTDERGLRESADEVEALIARERERNIEANRILLAGFSQGGVVALHAGLRHSEALAGIMALSCYLPEISGEKEEQAPANAAIPIFMAHGVDDPMIPIEMGEAGRDRLQELGHPVIWRPYEMQHEVCPEEIADIGVWLRACLADD
jgi:phospholipase/carboxylesterase